MSVPARMTTERSHLPALDGLRGVAILLVLVFHLTPWGQSAADQASAQLTAFGASGVDLFFVLSGFLITGVLWRSRGPGGLSSFWIRRVLRIWPLYGAVLVALFVVLPLVKHGWTEYPMNELWADRWYYWLHSTNIKAALQDRMSLPYKTDHFWSLAVEEQFYLLWPLVVLRIRTLDKLLRVSCWMIVGSWLLRIIVAGVLDRPVAAYVLMPTRMDGLAFGSAIFALNAMGRLGRWRRLAIPAGVVAFAVALTPGISAWSTTVRVAASICCAAFMVVILTGSASVVDRPWLRMFGRYSYGIYIVHQPLELALKPFEAWARGLPTLGGWSLPSAFVYFSGATAISLGLAMISYHLFERRFLSLKDRLAPTRRRELGTLQPAPAASVRD